MNLFVFSIFISLFVQNSFMMRESSEFSEGPSQEKPSQLSFKRFKDFFKREKAIIPIGCGLFGAISLYALSKKLPKQKRVSLAFLGAGMSGGLCFYFNKEKKKDDDKLKEDDKPSALIDRSFCTLDFWLHDAQAKEYLDLRKKIGKKTNEITAMQRSPEENEENTELLEDFIINIKTEINKKYYYEDEEAKDKQIDDLFNKFKAEEYKEKKVRIFNQFISFNSLCSFIENIKRKKLLYFLRNQATIKYNLQGELIEENCFENCSSEQLAVFLAFGYYTDSCAKFLYLEPNMLMTFLENALYYMYYTDFGGIEGRRGEEDDYYRGIVKPFEEHCKVKIVDVEFKEKGGEIKKHPTKITIEKIKEGQALRE